MIKRWEYFIKDALSYKSLDRSLVRSKYLMLKDGQSYDEFKDPFKQVAHHLWKDMQNYELKSKQCTDFEALSTSIPKLYWNDLMKKKQKLIHNDIREMLMMKKYSNYR